MRKRLFPLLGILFFCAQLFAQNRTVSGKITDDKGNAIPNASVLVKGTIVGTSTDNTGSFSLSVPTNAKALVISAVGMGEKEVNLTTSDSYTVSLSSSSVNM